MKILRDQSNKYVKDLYNENYKTLTNKNQRMRLKNKLINRKIERYSMFMDGKTQFFEDVISSQLNLRIQSNLNKNHSKLFCGHQQTDSKVYLKRQKNQNSQHNIEGEVRQQIQHDFETYFKATVTKTV